MSKMTEKLCLCSQLARLTSLSGQERAGRFAWCRQVTLDIPGATFSPQYLPSWTNCLETTKYLCQEPGVSHPHLPSPDPPMAK